MLRPTKTYANQRATVALTTATLLLAVAVIFTPAARARTYLMHQCAPGVPAVSPGWSVFGNQTQADTVLSDTCSAGGSIGVYVFTNEQAGVVTENGQGGSQVGLQIAVPSSLPGVTIHSIAAQVTASSVIGDDAFLGFSSSGQLPGAAELPYGGTSPYIASDSWTLPQGARSFAAYVNCTTDDKSPSCYFANATAVPALSDITLTLEDDTPPKVTSVSGPLATAAASGASVMGSQPITFTGTDSESGVHTATLTLIPLSGGAPSVHTFNFSGECSYEAWNACPLTQTVSGFSVNTTALANGTYAVSLTITDAADNVTNDPLGSVTVNNPTTLAGSLGALPGPGVGSPAASTRSSSPNGNRASEGAHLQLGVRSAISRSYSKRALRVSGRLLSAQGLPITGATLDVLQEINGASLELIDDAHTGPNGTFVALVPPDPSRIIEVAYRAFSTDDNYAATAQLRESVQAGVQLKVSRSRTDSKGKITLSGRVLAPIPPQGVIVELLVHYRGRWEPFRDPHTDGSGHFHAHYQFEGGIGRFPFRAEVPGNQAGFPFVGGKSRAVDVTTN